MISGAVTFDFHNTLAECPEWFDLEVKHLPSSFLSWWSASRAKPIAAKTLTAADEHYRQLRHEIMDHGRELSAEACLDAVFHQLAINLPGSDIEEGVALLMRGALETTRPIPGAVDTVRALRDAGVRLGVVSSAVYHPFLEWSLRMFEIEDAFVTIITSASAGFYKSRPEIYLHAASQLGVAPEHVVHVGDSLRFDVGGAGRAGMGTVWLQHRPRNPEELSFEPDLTLATLTNSFKAVVELLDRRDQRLAGQLA